MAHGKKYKFLFKHVDRDGQVYLPGAIKEMTKAEAKRFAGNVVEVVSDEVRVAGSRRGRPPVNKES